MTESSYSKPSYADMLRALKPEIGDVYRTDDGVIVLYLGHWNKDLADLMDDDLNESLFTEVGDPASGYITESVLNHNPVLVLRDGIPVTDDKVIIQLRQRIDDLQEKMVEIQRLVRSAF